MDVDFAQRLNVSDAGFTYLHTYVHFGTLGTTKPMVRSSWPGVV